MSKIKFTSNTVGTGTFNVVSPGTSTDRTIFLPDSDGTVFTTNELATIGEAQAGTSNTKLMTPQRTKDALNASGSAPTYACRAWVNFNGGGTIGANQTILANGNVASVFKNATGDYTITFSSALPDGNYSMSAMSVGFSSTNLTGSSMVTLYPSGSGTFLPLLKTSTQVRILTGNPSNGTPADSNEISVMFFR